MNGFLSRAWGRAGLKGKAATLALCSAAFLAMLAWKSCGGAEDAPAAGAQEEGGAKLADGAAGREGGAQDAPQEETEAKKAKAKKKGSGGKEEEGAGPGADAQDADAAAGAGEPAQAGGTEGAPAAGAQAGGAVRVTNPDAARPAMDRNLPLLEERLNEWAAQMGSTATEAEIIHASVPASDPGSIQFYLKLNDGNGTIAMLAYHPRENFVTAGLCQYSEQEVLSEAWSDNGPAERGAKDGPAEGAGG